MNFALQFTESAAHQLDEPDKDSSQAARCKAVRKTLGLMQTNLKHPGLKTHQYSSLEGPDKEKIFEAYAQNNTPGAYRVFWHYGPGQGILTVIAITPHP